MATDSLSEELFYYGEKRVARREIEAAEGNVDGLKTPSKGTGVVALWSRDLLVTDFGSPKCVGDLRLCNAFGSYTSVSPNDCAVAVLFRPIALSSDSALG